MIRINWIGPSTNALYSGMHWTKRKKIADEGHLMVASAVHGKCTDLPVHLTLTPHGGRKRDIDNFSFTVKVIIDGLVKAGWLPDDTDEYISGITILSHVKSKEVYMEIS